MPRKRVKFGEEASSVNRLRDNRYKHSNPIDANTGKVRRGRPRKEYIENNITRIALNEENLRKKQEEERIKAEKRVAQKQKNILSLIEHHKKAISRLDEKTTDNQASDLLEEVYLLMMDLTNNDIKKDINLWVRQECKKHPTEKCYKLFHKTFINGARLGSFDDYMVATEWRRVDNARFWLPRRKVLEGKHHICSQIDEFIKDPNARYLGISVPPGCGKALANDTPILTRNGWKKHGDIVVGDEVIGMDGKFKKVYWVRPKCMLDCLVTFTNGEQILCHEDHEWLVFDRHSRREKILETKYLMKQKLDNDGVGRGHRYFYQIPSRDYIEGEEKELHVDPYTLGVWLGDGQNLNPTVCGDKKDKAVIDKIVSNGYEISWTTEQKVTKVMYYGIKGLRQQLQMYGMCHSRRRTDKRIPEEYLTASFNQRLELLAGLIDTDGNLNGEKYCFTTCEEGLRDDFIKLVSTFGWRACVLAIAPTISSSGIIGRKTVYKIQFTPNYEIPCTLPRKLIKGVKGKTLRRIAIKSIERVEPQEGNCISVEDEMYLAGNTMIPTHNTTMIKFLLSYVCGVYPDSASMYCSANDGIVKMVYDSVTAMLTDTDEYDHNVIFPGSGLPTCSAEYKTISYRNKGDFPTVGMVSIGGSVTGRTRANKFLITDDLVQNKEMARSPERLNRLFEDYTATLTTRKIGDDVKEIQLGTIWSVHDPISRMREKYKDDKRYKFIAIPVCDEEGHSNFNYDHPDRYTDEKIAEIRNSLDPADFSCLYLQQGIDKEGLAFDGLRFYNGVLPDGEPDNIVMVADIAWGGGDSLSMPIAYIYGDEVYIHDVVFDNRDKTVTKPRVVGKLIQHHVRKGRMEANNGGDEYCDDVKRMLVERGYSMNLSHKKASTRISKISKIEQHAPTIRTFYFLDKKSRSKEYDKFMRELESYSFTSKNLHDDAPDSLAMLCEFIYNNKTVVSCRPLF